jgi:hypothetical protein
MKPNQWQTFLARLFGLLPLLVGCIGYRTPLDDVSTSGGADAGADSRRADLRSDTRTASQCTSVEPYVMLLGGDQNLHRFDPDTLALTRLAGVSCGGDELNSMAVSLLGPAYVSNHLGDLCVVDLGTFRSSLTPFNPWSILQSSFGMALLPDDVPAGQTLYIAPNIDRNSSQLSRIDLTTFALTNIGRITPDGPPPELTAGPNGELYGFSIGASSSLLLNIDPKTGASIDVTTVPAGYTNASFALVYWQGQFFLFLGDSSANRADVYGYRKGEAQVRHLGTLDVGIIGAGVAQCQ